MIPDKLKPGDLVRVIAPSKSLKLASKEVLKIAKERFYNMGLRVNFSKNSKKCDVFSSSSISQRISDLHEAFKDKKVKGILTAFGGLNSNQLLNHIDYNLIRKNPKVFCGYSDITVLLNAFYAKTKLITYLGPHYPSFGEKKEFDYSLNYFKKCVFEKEEYEIYHSKKWSDDFWFLNQNERKFFSNSGFQCFCEGKTEGTIIGGNLSSFCLLKGTEFMPDLKNKILFIEDENLMSPYNFDRNLESLIQLKSFSKVKGLIIGRFKKRSKVNFAILKKILNAKKELDSIPIIYNVDFGHTTPNLTIPIGGKISINAEKGKNKLKILEH